MLCQRGDKKGTMMYLLNALEGFEPLIVQIVWHRGRINGVQKTEV